MTTSRIEVRYDCEEPKVWYRGKNAEGKSVWQIDHNHGQFVSELIKAPGPGCVAGDGRNLEKIQIDTVRKVEKCRMALLSSDYGDTGRAVFPIALEGRVLQEATYDLHLMSTLAQTNRISYPPDQTLRHL